MNEQRQAEIEKRVIARKCIVPQCKSRIRSRGLCELHRSHFYQELNTKDSPEEKQQFEVEMIRQGLVLAKGGQVRILRRDRNVFSTTV